MRSTNLLLVLFSVCATSAPVALQTDEAKARQPVERPNRPNIIFVLADDLGIGDVSCCNQEAAWQTPNIDRLAAEGARFADAHSGSAVCTPTRYGVVTGRYAWRTRLQRGVLGGASDHLIDPDRYTTADLLHDHGYHTACIGKWHLGMDFTRKGDSKKIDFTGPVHNGPNSNGFDYYYCHNGSLDMAPYVYVENGRITAAPNRVTEDRKSFWRKGATGSDFVHEQVLPNFTERAVRYVEQRVATGKPFFLYLPLPAPHTPILPTAEFRGKSGTNAYGDFVLQVDATVGALLAALDRADIADDTLFVFTSDNGCSPQAKFDQLAKFDHHPSGPFRGHKADIYEGGHRVPFVVRWPGHIPPARICKETICLTDLMRTCADVLGHDLPDTCAEDSVSWLPSATDKPAGGGNAVTREAVVHHSINGSFAIRQGKWKLLMCPGSGGWSAPKPKPARTQRLPLIQLYDLARDPGERTNVATENPTVVSRLEALLASYVANGRSTSGQPQSNDRKVSFRPKAYPN